MEVMVCCGSSVPHWRGTLVCDTIGDVWFGVPKYNNCRTLVLRSVSQKRETRWSHCCTSLTRALLEHHSQGTWIRFCVLSCLWRAFCTNVVELLFPSLLMMNSAKERSLRCSFFGCPASGLLTGSCGSCLSALKGRCDWPRSVCSL
ncbi:hypothetical protein VTK73DRAFT_10189 [Phialemonium thermophilum]|uniref:Uncharacterized protein n=1 Tax=Phialemonium thermophilum TaxID=223376 RepID=A0ABR3XHY2_9PEZI